MTSGTRLLWLMTGVLMTLDRGLRTMPLEMVMLGSLVMARMLGRVLLSRLVFGRLLGTLLSLLIVI